MPTLIVLWFALGQLVMLAIHNSIAPRLVFELYGVLSPFFLSLRRMESIQYFNSEVAQAYASAMLLWIPPLFAILGRMNLNALLTGVRAKGRQNVLIAGSLFFLLGLIVFVSGFGAKGPGLVFRNSAVGFAFLISFLVFMSAFCLRLAFNLLIQKEVIGEK